MDTANRKHLELGKQLRIHGESDFAKVLYCAFTNNIIDNLAESIDVCIKDTIVWKIPNAPINDPAALVSFERLLADYRAEYPLEISLKEELITLLGTVEKELRLM